MASTITSSYEPSIESSRLEDSSSEKSETVDDSAERNPDAIGCTFLAAGRGMMTMSDIYLSSSLLWLAANAAGCFDGQTDTFVTGEACTNKIYGFTPSSLISNIAMIAGLTSACAMPICGAIIDFTPYRRALGIVTAIVLVVIQGIQVYTVESTWLAMAILQCISLAFFQLMKMVTYSYLPEIASAVGQTKMTRISSKLSACQFFSQAVYLVVIVTVQLVLQSSAVLTAQISQGLNVITSALFFGIAWLKYMTPRQAIHNLPQGRNILTAGFRQNWKTAMNIQRRFKKGLRWFFYAISFGEAVSTAIPYISIIFLFDFLKLNTTQVGIFFLIVLVSTLLGTKIGSKVSQKTNPNTSLKCSMAFVFVVLFIGALFLEYLPKYITFIWALLLGMGIGWIHATRNLFFSMCVPRGEGGAEMAGFFVYCTQILSWVPPLVFTLCMESGIGQKYGVILGSAFYLIAVIFLCCAESWEEIVLEAKSSPGTTDNYSEGMDPEEESMEKSKATGATAEEV